jgi:quercetin dioxygenase-like cupin family protein
MSPKNPSAKLLEIKNLSAAIAQAPLDPKVNIKIAPLAGDETMTIYSTMLKPKSQVTAHVHSQGVELYHIVKGQGEIYTGRLNDQEVSWNLPKKVQEGDVFAIEAGIVHQLKNTGQEDLLLVFVCPPTHLTSDRLITWDYSAK